MFLLGAGGAALAIPFLPSLLSPREAHAQAVPPLKRYIHFATDHGGIWQANMQPPASMVTEMRPYADRMIKRGDLAPSIVGSDAVISPVLTAPTTALTPTLVRKMNVLHGLDIPFYIAHNTGGHLGNYARNDGNGGDGQIVQGYPRPTIDQLMAWSPSFYRDLSNVRLRSVTGGRLSWDWSDPIARRGVVQEVTGRVGSATGVFDDLMGTGNSSPRRPLTDRVLASYQRLRNSNRRLGAEDRRRLDEHIARVTELNRQLTTMPVCAGATRPAADAPTNADYGYDPAAQVARWQQQNDVIAVAMACGATRLAAIHANDTFSDYRGDWHQDIAHKAHLPTGVEQQTLSAANALFFRSVFLDLAIKLDAIDDGNSRTVLDNTLLVWTQESGPYTHDNNSCPVVTFGSAGGALRTGSYIDYRNLDIVTNPGGYQGSTEITYAGLLYSQFLATVLNAMDIPSSEWAEPANAPGATPGSGMGVDPGGGYGLRYIADATKYPPAVQQNNNDTLPYLAP
jgi:hypothetical protein